MEQPQQIKTISAIVIVLLVLGVGYVLYAKYRAPRDENQQVSNSSDNAGGNQKPMKVVVENSPVVNGALSVPIGFPKDIPIEKGVILESATTNYPDQKAEQLSLSYRSSKTIAQKYAEYKDYMSRAGYTLTEGSTSAPVRAIFGTKENANLSVAISSSKGKTLVQLSYLLKSVSR